MMLKSGNRPLSRYQRKNPKSKNLASELCTIMCTSIAHAPLTSTMKILRIGSEN